MITVISLGGSIIAPANVDEEYLAQFVFAVNELLQENQQQKFIFVVGGGGPARAWQKAYTAVVNSLKQESIASDADWIGIMATRLNAQLVKAAFGSLCGEDVVTDPSAKITFNSRILVAAGWKPGFSTDNDAVLLAKKFNAKMVINLSNIEKVFTADPRNDPSAKPIDKISWNEFRALVGDNWTPGKNVPFDPVASKNAQEANLEVICAAGKNIENLKNIIKGLPFTGTQIAG
ncbi:MAG: UMP kinase [Spirochaetaceae bacterium]|jgi:uridylate kinase|nr:UMP kinase [Spirochaetaceae bacterium]